MILKNNYSLLNYNSFKINVKAKEFIEVNSTDELKEICKINNQKEILFLGGGSNILFTKDFQGLIIHLNLKGKTIEKIDSNHSIISAYAGENWNKFVNYCLEKNLGGIENLSLIPGNVGSAPVQNIGAYGTELKDVFVSCEVFNQKDYTVKEYNLDDCCFDYRNSIFKTKKHLIIISVKLKLTNKDHYINSSYGGVNDELERLGIKNPTIRDVSEAVINIRNRKLPDPKNIGNAGSFFKNPIVDLKKIEAIKKNFIDIPNFKVEENKFKIPAAWLIEKAGFKGKNFGKFGVHKSQSLVLVNYGNASGKDIYKLSLSIKEVVNKIFKINLETEVNII